jgi:hypothetical protein
LAVKYFNETATPYSTAAFSLTNQSEYGIEPLMFTVYSNADVPEFANPKPHAARGFSLAPSTAAGTGVIPNGDYFIKNVNSGRYMYISGGSTSNGAGVLQYQATGLNQQIFTVTNNGANCSIKPKHVTFALWQHCKRNNSGNGLEQQHSL